MVIFLAFIWQVLVSQQSPLEKFLADPALKGALVGILVQTDVEQSQTLYAYNETKRFMPASNTKLFTSAIALEKLGEDFVFVTPLLTDGQISNETLTGNLYIRGSGDPSLTRNRLRELAKGLVSKGIKNIKGDIIVDISAFPDNRWGQGWSWDYLHFGYAAEVWAIALDRNSVNIQIAPALEEGQPSQVSLTPPTNWITVENNVVTVKSGQNFWSIWRDPWERVVRIWGRISLNTRPEILRISVPSIPHYVGETFRSILQEFKISVEGHVKVGLTPQSAKVIAETKSEPLRELVRWLNKVSDNLYAEMLMRVIALKEKGQGSLPEALSILEQKLREWGIDPDEVRLTDGSGLSRLNMVTPRAIVQLLKIAQTRPWFDAFKNSLPIAGVDGTLRTRLRGTPAEGRVYAKTGYIGNVASLSGYVQSNGKVKLVFSVLVNHYNAPTRQVQLAIDSFVSSLAEMR